LFIGAAYLDFPANLLSARISVDRVVNKPMISRPPVIFPDIQNIESAAELIINAERPLVIVGKGKEILKNYNITIFTYIYIYVYALCS